MMKALDLPPPVTGYLRGVTERARAAAEDRLVGVWLFGSAALGDFSATRSDLDVQAVVTTPLNRAEREALAARLSHEALPCPVRGLEFVLYAEPDLVLPEGPAFGLNLNIGPRIERAVNLEAGEQHGFWFVLDISIGRRHGHALAGPEAAEVFPEPDPAAVRRALRDALDWYAAHGGSPVETVLSACRAWAFATDGRWRSKAEAARWARTRLDDSSTVDRALRLRDGTDEPPLTGRDTRPLVESARAAASS
ncbi:MAG: DUF4111 domain-containing protein [Thermoleophilaceae bacterium]|nr:DUF4111 domain-containing protein [Thermoleophilaceae bacterium]